MYDGPGHCLRWVLNDPQMYATDFKPENIFMCGRTPTHVASLPS